MPLRDPVTTRLDAVERVRCGARPVDVAALLGISPTTVYRWLHADAAELVRRRLACCRCAAQPGLPADEPAYAHLLGSYLGDGCLSRGRAAWNLRISCDDAWPGVADEVPDVLRRVSGAQVQRTPAPGCHAIGAWWQHWPCLLPQHGPGKKHERPIVLEPWQLEIVERHPGRLLRGLFHSDGWRGHNVAVHRKDGS